MATIRRNIDPGACPDFGTYFERYTLTIYRGSDTKARYPEEWRDAHAKWNQYAYKKYLARCPKDALENIVYPLGVRK